MNLGKKYKQLFEGKVRSNDSRLLKENEYEQAWHGEVAKAYEDFARKNQLKGIIYSEGGEEMVTPKPNASPKQIGEFVKQKLIDNYDELEEWIGGLGGTGQVDVVRDGEQFMNQIDKMMEELNNS